MKKLDTKQIAETLSCTIRTMTSLLGAVATTIDEAMRYRAEIGSKEPMEPEQFIAPIPRRID